MDKLMPMGSRELSAPSANTLGILIEAKKGAKRLLGCYRTGDANDPEVYVSGVVAVLSRYSIEIIREVTEPATGLPAKLKWLPSISEIREECETHEARAKRKLYLERQLTEQFASRELPQYREERTTYEELQRRCADVGLMIGPKGSRLPPIDPAKIQQQYGISKAAWDAIPNANRGK